MKEFQLTIDRRDEFANYVKLFLAIAPSWKNE